MLTWQQCLLASKLLYWLKHRRVNWSLFCGAILWIAWLDRNAKSFSNDNLSTQKTQVFIWEAILELGCTAWLRVTNLCQLHPLRSPEYISDFDRAWFQTKFLIHEHAGLLVYCSTALWQLRVGCFWLPCANFSCAPLGCFLVFFVLVFCRLAGLQPDSRLCIAIYIGIQILCFKKKLKRK